MFCRELDGEILKISLGPRKLPEPEKFRTHCFLIDIIETEWLSIRLC